ncbi:Hypothetical protein PFR_JS23_2068 [Propionibacterium freudenreichii]|uniref:Uncharacterized protein n=1 Tax=Propionibacterium freudenreichii TaxID=1744 RepID=A0A509MK15_9ACTN|nr:Hypothetical protein PFR_JS23_2068 [Propionibacterium freudenreichii]
MAVDAPQRHRAVVEAQDHVVDRDLSQTHLVGDDLVWHLQQQGVQLRVLGVPQAWPVDVEFDGVAVPAGVVGLGQHTAGHRRAICAEQRGPGLDRATHVGGTQAHRGAGLVDLGSGEVVEQVTGRAVDEVNVAEDAAGAELVLVLEVGAVTPLEHQHRHVVGALHERLGDIELARGVADLAVTDVVPVHPHVEAGVDALEDQRRVGRRRVGVVIEGGPVGAAGVVHGDVGRVQRDRVAHVGVLVSVVALMLPSTRNGDWSETLDRAPGVHEGLVQVVDRVVVAEVPLTVEQLDPVGRLTGGDDIGHCR